MTDWAKEAITSLGDGAKQLITLSTGFIALTVTLSEAFIKRSTRRERRTMIASWIAYLLSIIAGVLVLYAVTGALGDATAAKPPDIFSEPMMALTAVQQILFLIGTLLAVVYGIRIVNKSS